MARDKNEFISALGLSGEEKLLIAHIDDMIKISEKTCADKFSAFLSESGSALAQRYLQYCGRDNYMLYGGYENAQRVMLGIFGQYSTPDTADFPLVTVRFTMRPEDRLTHRDFLGSLMSLGIERDQTGDILCGEGRTYAVLCPAAAELAVMQITKIGRTGVKCCFADDKDIIVREDKFSDISATVSSLRLDCIVGAAAHISRDKSASLIRSGAVSVNHCAAESVSAAVSEGDTISVRGFGRFILHRIGGITKKDRIHITVKKYM